MRQVVLDTETTGLEHSQGHRVIEIGCVELLDRRITRNQFHCYLNPDREIDAGAIEVHGITNEMLADKPYFADVADEFLAYINGAELVIHNAAFDVGFLNHELGLLGKNSTTVETGCDGVIDTLALARNLHPGQRNSLDALCKRYDIDNSQRQLHGALLDAEILADVYLAMTGGQTDLSLNMDDAAGSGAGSATLDVRSVSADRPPLKVIRASEEELAAHAGRLAKIGEGSGQGSLWESLWD